MLKIAIDEGRCKGCELCIDACAKKCLEIGRHLNSRGVHPAVVEPAKCTGCQNCALVCPDVAITFTVVADERA
jgi:2-oxoglutarate ferredoxin oxidoreductase subunit delta